MLAAALLPGLRRQGRDRRGATRPNLCAASSELSARRLEGVVVVVVAQHGRRTLALIAADEEQLAEAAAAVEEDPSRL